MQIIPLNLDSVLLSLHNSKLAYWIEAAGEICVTFLFDFLFRIGRTAKAGRDRAQKD